MSDKKFSYINKVITTVDELIPILEKLPKDYSLSACGIPFAVMIDHENKSILLDEVNFIADLLDEQAESEIEEIELD